MLLQNLCLKIENYTVKLTVIRSKYQHLPIGYMGTKFAKNCWKNKSTKANAW